MALNTFTGTKNTTSALDELANLGTVKAPASTTLSPTVTSNAANPGTQTITHAVVPLQSLGGAVKPAAPAVTPAAPKPIPAGTVGNAVAPNPTVAPGSPAATPVLPTNPAPGGTSVLRNPLSPATTPPQLTVPGATGTSGVATGGTGGGVGIPDPGYVVSPNQPGAVPGRAHGLLQKADGTWYENPDIGFSAGNVLGVQSAYWNQDPYVLGANPDFARSLSASMQSTANNASANIQNAGLSGQALANQGAGQLMTEGVNAAQYGLSEGRNLQQLGNRLSATGEGIGGMALDAGDAAAMRGGIAADYGASRDALGQLAGLESSAGPSGAQALLNQGAANSMQQNLALARSGRGYGGNAQAVSEALRQNSATMQSVGNASAQLRAQEDAAQRQRAAANLSTAAGLYSTQASQDQAAALQARAQNDAAQQALYGLGAQTTLQGMNQGAGIVQAGAGLGLAGRETGANLYNQGVQTGLAGNQQAMQAMQTGAGLEQQALQSTGQVAQIQGQFGQNWVDQYFAERAADEGIAAQRRQQDQQLLGAGLGAAATVGAGLLMLSDVRAKTKIKPATREDLFLSPDDSLLRSPRTGDGALDQLANMTGEEADASEFDRYGLASGERPSDAYRAGLNRYAPYAAGGPINAPMAGHGARGPDPDAYAASLRQGHADQAAARERDASLAATGKEWILGGLRQAGQGLAHYGDYDPSLYRTQRRRQYQPVVIGGQHVLSDEREKTDLRAAKGYSYEYKDPTAPGAAPGRQVGPMAQDLLRTSAADAVVPQRNGRLAVDAGRLTMHNTSAISEQQRRIDELEHVVNQLGGKRSRQPASAPEVPPVSADAFTRPGAAFQWSAPPEHSGNLGGFDRFGGVGAPVAPPTTEGLRVLEPSSPEATRERGTREQLIRSIALDRKGGRPLGPELAPPPKLSGPRTVARQAIASGLDAAALPVTLAGKGLEYAGYPNAAAHLSGMDAVEAGEWAISGREPAETRREEEWNEQDMPQAGQVGRVVGDVAGGWALGSLTGRIPGAAAMGPVLHAVKRDTKGETTTRAQWGARGQGRVSVLGTDAKSRALARHAEAVENARRNQPFSDSATYWRVQGAGDPLSTSHRSKIGNNTGYEEGGTSALPTLVHMQHWARKTGVGAGKGAAYEAPQSRGDVDLIKFRGYRTGEGSDWEPTVQPAKELRRIRIPKDKYDAAMRSTQGEEGIIANGGYYVDPQPVEGAKYFSARTNKWETETPAPKREPFGFGMATSGGKKKSTGLGTAAVSATDRERQRTLARLNETGLENTKYARDTINPDKLAVTREPYRGVTPERANEVAAAQKPVEVGVYPDGAALTDGRHRMIAAKEAGATEVPALVKTYDSQGRVVAQSTQPVSIDARPPAHERLVARTGELERRYRSTAVREKMAEAEPYWRDNPAQAESFDRAAQYYDTAPDRAVVQTSIENNSNLNKYLRTREAEKQRLGDRFSPDKAMENRAEATNKALQGALDAGHRFPDKSYRTLNLRPEVIQDWKDRGYVRNDSILSTSANPAFNASVPASAHPRGSVPVKIELEPGHGVPLAGMSKFPHEQEVMIPSGRNWKVAGTRVDEQGLTVITLRPVDSVPAGVTPAVTLAGGALPQSAALLAATTHAIGERRRKGSR